MDLVVRIDRTACHGSGSCARRAPGAFSLDAERKAVLRDPPRESPQAIRAAAACCPFFAIEVSDERSPPQPLFPPKRGRSV